MLRSVYGCIVGVPNFTFTGECCPFGEGLDSFQYRLVGSTVAAATVATVAIVLAVLIVLIIFLISTFIVIMIAVIKIIVMGWSIVIWISLDTHVIVSAIAPPPPPPDAAAAVIGMIVAIDINAIMAIAIIIIIIIIIASIGKDGASSTFDDSMLARKISLFRKINWNLRRFTFN